VQANLIQSWESFDHDALRLFELSLGARQIVGLQSYQYRMSSSGSATESPDGARLRGAIADCGGSFRRRLSEPSIYDDRGASGAGGVAIPEDKLVRDFAEPYIATRALPDAWRLVYRDAGKHWIFTSSPKSWSTSNTASHLWRYTHMKTSELIVAPSQEPVAPPACVPEKGARLRSIRNCGRTDRKFEPRANHMTGLINATVHFPLPFTRPGRSRVMFVTRFWGVVRISQSLFPARRSCSRPDCWCPRERSRSCRCSPAEYGRGDGRWRVLVGSASRYGYFLTDAGFTRHPELLRGVKRSFAASVC